MWRVLSFAEEVGFEPTETFASAVFKTARFDHSRTPPECFYASVEADGAGAGAGAT